MLAKPYIIRGNNYADSCIVKVSYGMYDNKAQRAEPKPFVIVKCKRQSGALKNIEDSLNAFIRGGKNNPGGLYFHLFNHVKNNPDQTFVVETILESDNGYQLLKTEQMLLDECATNPLCLNNQLEAYIPAYDEDNECYGWLTRQNVMLFHKYMKARSKKAKVVKAAKKSAATLAGK